MGIRLGRVAAGAWAVAGALAAIGGVFFTSFPAGGVSNATGLLALSAIPAAVLGGLDSTAGRVVGGLMIGVAPYLRRRLPGRTVVPRPRAVRRRALRGAARRAAVAAVRAVRDAGGDPCLRLARRRVAIAVIVVLLWLPHYLEGFWLQTGLFAMAAAIAAIGLTLLVGVTGQLSLAHAFFVADRRVRLLLPRRRARPDPARASAPAASGCRPLLAHARRRPARRPRRRAVQPDRRRACAASTSGWRRSGWSSSASTSCRTPPAITGGYNGRDVPPFSCSASASRTPARTPCTCSACRTASWSGCGTSGWCSSLLSWWYGRNLRPQPAGPRAGSGPRQRDRRRGHGRRRAGLPGGGVHGLLDVRRARRRLARAGVRARSCPSPSASCCRSTSWS